MASIAAFEPLAATGRFSFRSFNVDVEACIARQATRADNSLQKIGKDAAAQASKAQVADRREQIEAAEHQADVELASRFAFHACTHSRILAAQLERSQYGGLLVPVAENNPHWDLNLSMARMRAFVAWPLGCAAPLAFCNTIIRNPAIPCSTIADLRSLSGGARGRSGASRGQQPSPTTLEMNGVLLCVFVYVRRVGQHN